MNAGFGRLLDTSADMDIFMSAEKTDGTLRHTGFLLNSISEGNSNLE